MGLKEVSTSFIREWLAQEERPNSLLLVSERGKKERHILKQNLITTGLKNGLFPGSGHTGSNRTSIPKHETGILKQTEGVFSHRKGFTTQRSCGGKNANICRKGLTKLRQEHWHLLSRLVSV